MQQLYGLQVDFIHLHGHFMVVSAAEGLKAEMLSGLQLTMMTMNRIPRLLEMQTEEKDGEIKLFYNVTGKRMLTHRLRSEKLTLLRFYSLLLEIADVLDDSKIYMLQPGRYILKEDFIYCGNGLEELYFTYIPKEQLDNKSSVSMDLQHLASRWIHRVDVLQGNGFQELMSYLQEENFNIPELKQLLLKHIRILGHGLDQPLSSGEQIGFAEKDDFPQGKDAIPLKEPGMARASKHAVFETPDSPAYSAASAATGEKIAALDMGSEPDKRAKRNKTVIGLSALLGCSFLWKWYLDEPGTVTLYSCTGLTVVLLAAAWVLVRRTALSFRRQDPREKAMEEWLSGFVTEPQNRPGPDFSADIGLESGQSDLDDLKHIPPQYPVDNGTMQTTLLRTNDATVFLGGEEQKTQAAVPALEYAREGRRSRAAILKESFLIGRAAGEADLVSDEKGVSRVHAELVKDGSEYAIRDLGSRNGTFVNGELLVPYRMQLLQEGDIVKIITTEYTFRMGS